MKLQVKVLSSEKSVNLKEKNTSFGKSLMNVRNIKGPSIEPYQTPELTKNFKVS